MKRFLAILLTSFLLFASGRARADEAPVPAAARPVQLHFDLGFGPASRAHEANAHGGAIALLRLDMFQFGVAAHYSQIVLDGRYGFGAVAGLGLHGTSHIGFDALVEVGSSSYGTRGSHDVAYVGARLGANVFVGRPAHRFRTTLGLWLYAQHDLERQEVSGKRVGGWAEVGVRFALGFDVTPG